MEEYFETTELILGEIGNLVEKLSKTRDLEKKLVYSEIARNLSETLKNNINAFVSLNDLREELEYYEDEFNEFDEDEYGDNGNGG